MFKMCEKVCNLFPETLYTDKVDVRGKEDEEEAGTKA